MMFVISIQLNQFPATLICLTTLFQILLFSAYLWLAATMIAAKTKENAKKVHYISALGLNFVVSFAGNENFIKKSKAKHR